MAPGKKAKGGCSRQTREGRLPDEQERGLRQAPLPRRHGQPRGQSNKPTAPPCNSSSPPRPARRSTAEQDPYPLGRRMAEAALAYWKRRWSAAPRLASPEKRNHGGDNPKPGSSRSDPGNSTADGKKPTTARSKQLNLYLRPPAPPHRHSQPAAPARVMAGWAC
jgi:hypothetical protein